MSGPRPPDLYPRTPDDDMAAIKREQQWRDNELADLPDALTEEQEVEMAAFWRQWLEEGP